MEDRRWKVEGEGGRFWEYSIPAETDRGLSIILSRVQLWAAAQSCRQCRSVVILETRNHAATGTETRGVSNSRDKEPRRAQLTRKWR